jgi:hypothetical protein
MVISLQLPVTLFVTGRDALCAVGVSGSLLWLVVYLELHYLELSPLIIIGSFGKGNSSSKGTASKIPFSV